MLEAAATASDDSPEREALLIACKLTAGHRDILAKVLARGRWRGAACPLEYLRKNVIRRYLRQEEGGRNPREVNLGDSYDEGEDSSDWLDRMSQNAETSGVVSIWVKEAGRTVQRSGLGLEESQDASLYALPDFIVTHVPPELRQLSQADWEELATRAGLDEWEEVVILHRVNGNSRDRALRSYDNDSDKKALVAAWKRVERTGLRKLESALVLWATKFSTGI